MKKGRLIGIIMLILGIFCIYWAQTHSPESGLGTKLSREISGSYSLSMPGYIFSLVTGTALTVLGALRVYRAK